MKKHNDKFYIVSGKEFFINMEKAFISCLFILQRKGAILNRLKGELLHPTMQTIEGRLLEQIHLLLLLDRFKGSGPSDTISLIQEIHFI